MSSVRINTVITGTGSYIPKRIIPNESFMLNDFYDVKGNRIETPNAEIIEKFKSISGIDERRYTEDNVVASDIGSYAAEDAIESSHSNRETFDYIIFAHNFGDITNGSNRSDMVPSLAARVKHYLKIENPHTVAYDLIFGCPGWLQGMITADYLIKSGDARKIMVIGAETLSRIIDPHDRDSMLYADGAGATIVEAVEGPDPVGIITHEARSDTRQHAQLMWMGPSNRPDSTGNNKYIKMNGHRLYEYAITYVPQLVKDIIDKAAVVPTLIKKILIHQANAKLDQEIINRLFKLFGIGQPPPDIMPMTISFLGNSSVATIPMLVDFLWKGKLNGHILRSGEYAVFASVGAGMNINAIVYKKD
jgi:3-oxoacyl-[acyl-carrier-protein] synthase-3